MLKSTEEKVLAKILAVGVSFTTVFLVSNSVTDPVNVTKLLALGITSFAALGLILSSGSFTNLRKFLPVSIAVLTFIVSATISVLLSDSPTSQGMYGSYGRNNGFVAYLFLSVILISTLFLEKIQSFALIIRGLIVAGLINVLYCLWVILFGDFIGWNNPYGNILGTLGNPNFIGSFLGIFISVYLAYSLGKSSPRWFKFSALLVLPVTAYEIVDSHAIQGRVVGLAGVAIVGFFYVKSKFSTILSWLYGIGITLIGLMGLAGALQIGPLTSYIYKTSVSLRGQYWLAGWRTGESHPITGVGMDAFGDWYRRSRDVHALELPGVNTVVNAAHNVPIDLFAFGGWPLFISYLAIVGLGATALVRVIRRTAGYDPILVSITTAWIGYHLQSIISINQIGLAVWGWVLTGAAIAYERVSRPTQLEPETSKSKFSKRVHGSGQEAKSTLYAFGFALIGLIIALPPLTADVKWRSAQLGKTVQGLELTMQSSYFNPQNTTKYLSNIQALEESGFFDLSHKYALKATIWNPESFELWKVLYLIRNSSEKEKEAALSNMKRLDPLNPDVTAR